MELEKVKKEMVNEMTTISISKTNRTSLMKHGKFGESFDDIITKLLEGKK